MEALKVLKLFMQDIKCEQKNIAGNASSARVSAVFRMRYGLNNVTVAAEGIWKSTSGQLCMAGCLGLVDVDGSQCNSRICLYVPISFSVKQRNIFMEVYPAPITVVHRPFLSHLKSYCSLQSCGIISEPPVQTTGTQNLIQLLLS